MLKVLNLYAGIGGNRKLWPKDIEVVAVEIKPDISAVYKDLYPDDTVLTCDAHQYLIEHLDDGWDFIWSSPPCPTHSDFRRVFVDAGRVKLSYPDMTLYQEIILLENFCDTLFCVENVISYYTPLVKPQEVNNHYLWANFPISYMPTTSRGMRKDRHYLAKKVGIDLDKYDIIDKRKILRNCTEPELGLHIFNCAFKKKQTTLNIDYSVVV